MRLARATLAKAVKVGLAAGVLVRDPLAKVPRPVPTRSVPRHWSPDQARQFLALMEGNRTYPIWAFMMSTGTRIGELGYDTSNWPHRDGLKWPHPGACKSSLRSCQGRPQRCWAA